MRLIGLIGTVIILALSWVPAIPAQMCGPQGIVGTWSWFDGEKVIANSDGTLLVYPNAGSSQPSDTGTWEQTDASNQVFTLHWSKGWTDTLTLSSDCNILDGYNQQNTHVTGTRTTSGSTGKTALYRWWNLGSTDHFYTTDPSGEYAPSNGYTSEGITGYIATSPQPGTTALYRWWNLGAADHFYTTDPSGEYAPSNGYTSEGITGYIWTSG